MQGIFLDFFNPIWNNAHLYTYLLGYMTSMCCIATCVCICIVYMYLCIYGYTYYTATIAYNLSVIYAFPLTFVTDSINIIQTAFMFVLRFGRS